MLIEDSMVTVKGKVSIRNGQAPSVNADSVIPWETKTEEDGATEKLYLRFNTLETKLYNKVVEALRIYQGNTPVIVKCTSKNAGFHTGIKVELNNHLLNELYGLIGESNIVVQ